MSKTEGTINLKANIQPALQDIKKVEKYATRVSRWWHTHRRKIMRGVRRTVTAVRRVSAVVVDWLESVGMSLTPMQKAMLDSAFAVIAWLLSVETAISAGTLGIGAAAAIAAGGVAVAIMVAANIKMAMVTDQAKADIRLQSDIMKLPFELVEIFFER